MAKRFVALVLAVPILGGCAIYDQAILPALTGEFHGGNHQYSGTDDQVAVGMEQLTPRASAILPAGEVLETEAGPLAIVRFETPDPAFEEALQGQIARALAARPDASFSLVAVSPADKLGGLTPLNETTTQRNMERVLAALTKAGVPEDRVIFAATSDDTAAVDEVRVYLLDLTKAP
jgi:hypothetical protein